MGVDAVYLLNEKKQIRRVIVWGVYELIHDEATYELDAEIASEYDARPGEFLAFFDVDAHLRLFEIDSAERDERRNVTAIVATDAAVAELAHLIVPEIRLTGATAQEAGQSALAGSGWQLGEVSAEGKSDLSAYRDKRWKVLRDIAVQYQARVTPYFVIENGEIIGKIVDVTARENVFRGRLFEGTSGSAQIYVTRSGSPVTKMYGIGKAIGTEDPPTCVTFADVEAPDKPKGQTYIEDADAIALFGEGREDVFLDKYIEDPNELLEKTRAALKKRSKPKVSGTATASDMEHVPGYEHMIVRLYDLVWVRTKTGEDLQAVVINIKRNYLRRGLTKITIGEEADDSGLIAKVAKLSSTSSSLSKSSSAASNRYFENKQLIQLNAVTIQMNARLIEANAEQIRLTASNMERYQAGTDERLTTAELTLFGDGTSAQAGLVARVEDHEGEISRAALTLYGDGTSANAGLVAKVSDAEGEISRAGLTLYGDGTSANAGLVANVARNEAGLATQNAALLDLKADTESATATLSARVNENAATITATANALESELELKADKITLNGYVTANQLETEFTKFESGISDSLYVSALSANTFECSSFSFKGNGVSLKRTEYVKSVGRTKRYVKSPSDVTIEIWEISSISNDTIYYLGWE